MSEKKHRRALPHLRGNPATVECFFCLLSQHTTSGIYRRLIVYPRPKLDTARGSSCIERRMKSGVPRVVESMLLPESMHIPEHVLITRHLHIRGPAPSFNVRKGGEGSAGTGLACIATMAAKSYLI